jgi:Na+/H+ antiporter NhaD/arsenite permease-like protein
MAATFIIGYLFIVFEQVLRIDKTGVVLLMAIASWILLFLNPHMTRATDLAYLQNQFLHVSEVATFILIVLVVVEIIQVHEGFSLITQLIRPRSKRLFFWTVGFITFFLSTMIANVTATLIMIAIAAQFLQDKEEKMIVGAGIVIASNAGGAWTPIGDVTTTMLWIAQRISTLPTLRDIFLPSIVSMIVTFFFLTFQLKGEVIPHIHVKKRRHCPIAL